MSLDWQQAHTPMLHDIFETPNDAVDELRARRTAETSQLRPGLNSQVLIFGELIVVVQTLRVRESTRGFDDLARHNLFDWQFYFLQVHCCL